MSVWRVASGIAENRQKQTWADTWKATQLLSCFILIHLLMFYQIWWAVCRSLSAGWSGFKPGSGATHWAVFFWSWRLFWSHVVPLQHHLISKPLKLSSGFAEVPPLSKQTQQKLVKMEFLLSLCLSVWLNSVHDTQQETQQGWFNGKQEKELKKEINQSICSWS